MVDNHPYFKNRKMPVLRATKPKIRPKGKNLYLKRRLIRAATIVIREEEKVQRFSTTPYDVNYKILKKIFFLKK